MPVAPTPELVTKTIDAETSEQVCRPYAPGQRGSSSNTIKDEAGASRLRCFCVIHPHYGIVIGPPERLYP